jgi:hypothetical protein
VDNTWLIVAATASGLSAIAGLWVKVVQPLARFISVSVALADSIPIWQEIAAEFKPDSGSTLHDRMATADTQRVDAADAQALFSERIAALEATQAEMGADIKVVSNKLDTFLLDRMTNGRRIHDPHTPE